MSGHADDQADLQRIDERHILAVRVGHGANCSSIGSVIDTLFAGAVLGAAIFAVVAAAMKAEPVKVVERQPRDPRQPGDNPGGSSGDSR